MIPININHKQQKTSCKQNHHIQSLVSTQHARLKAILARCTRGSISAPYDHLEHFRINHIAAAQALVNREIRLEALNDLIGGFGVEVVGDCNCYPPNIKAEYINTVIIQVHPLSPGRVIRDDPDSPSTTTSTSNTP
jgi:hypothetical protein